MLAVPLAIVAALDDEIRILRSKVSADARIHRGPVLLVRGTYEGLPLLLLRTGMGTAAMAEAMRFCLEFCAPAAILHVGYCGAAEPSLSAGDLIIASSAIDAASGRRFPADAALQEQARRAAEGCHRRHREGALVTVDRLVGKPFEKAAVGASHGALGIDMESAALAAAAAERGVPWVAVRAVLDPLEASLPDLADVLDEAGRPRAMALLDHLLRAPRDLLALPRVFAMTVQARLAIQAFLDAWLLKERP